MIHVLGKINSKCKSRRKNIMYTRINNAGVYTGLSSDTKPINKDVTNGSIFIEMDTNKVFMFDKENSIWRLQ